MLAAVTIPAPQLHLLIAVVLIAVVVPLLNELVTTVHANQVVKTTVALVLAGVGAVVAKITGTSGLASTQELITAAIGGLSLAGGLSQSVYNGPVKAAVASIAPGIGIGPSTAGAGQGVSQAPTAADTALHFAVSPNPNATAVAASVVAAPVAAAPPSPDGTPPSSPTP